MNIRQSSFLAVSAFLLFTLAGALFVQGVGHYLNLSLVALSLPLGAIVSFAITYFYFFDCSKKQLFTLGFMLQAGVLIRLDGKTDISTYPVTRCEQEGCFVEKLLKGRDLDSLRNAKQGVIVVMNREGKAVGFPFSLNGFGDAVDSMTRRNKKAAGG